MAFMAQVLLLSRKGVHLLFVWGREYMLDIFDSQNIEIGMLDLDIHTTTYYIH